MNAVCYILFSQNLNRFYTGITNETPQSRLSKHLNQYYGKKHFTAAAIDWEIFLTIPANDLAQARRIEIHIKKMKSKDYIRNLKKYPEMILKLLENTSST